MKCKHLSVNLSEMGERRKYNSSKLTEAWFSLSLLSNIHSLFFFLMSTRLYIYKENKS